MSEKQVKRFRRIARDIANEMDRRHQRSTGGPIWREFGCVTYGGALAFVGALLAAWVLHWYQKPVLRVMTANFAVENSAILRDSTLYAVTRFFDEVQGCRFATIVAILPGTVFLPEPTSVRRGVKVILRNEGRASATKVRSSIAFDDGVRMFQSKTAIVPVLLSIDSTNLAARVYHADVTSLPKDAAVVLTYLQEERQAPISRDRRQATGLGYALSVSTEELGVISPRESLLHIQATDAFGEQSALEFSSGRLDVAFSYRKAANPKPGVYKRGIIPIEMAGDTNHSYSGTCGYTGPPSSAPDPTSFGTGTETFVVP